jgi:hypothetical protein
MALVILLFFRDQSHPKEIEDAMRERNRYNALFQTNPAVDLPSVGLQQSGWSKILV